MKKYIIMILSIFVIMISFISVSYANYVFDKSDDISDIRNGYNITQVNNYQEEDIVIVSSGYRYLSNNTYYLFHNTNPSVQGHLSMRSGNAIYSGYPTIEIYHNSETYLMNVYEYNSERDLISESSYNDIAILHNEFIKDLLIYGNSSTAWAVIELIKINPLAFNINYNDQYTYIYDDKLYFPSTPSKSGYLFKGWSTDSDLWDGLQDEAYIAWELRDFYYNDYDYLPYEKPTINIYENWQKITNVTYWNIDFDLNGGVGSFPTYSYDSSNVQIPSFIQAYKPTREGYIFVGWKYDTMDPNLKGLLNPTELSTIDDGIFIAQWLMGSFDDGYDEGFIAGLENGRLEYRAKYGIYLNNRWYSATEYGQLMYYNGLNENEQTGFSSILSSVFIGIGSVLGIELLPNISIGAIILIPIVFGLIAFILGRKK